LQTAPEGPRSSRKPESARRPEVIHLGFVRRSRSGLKQTKNHLRNFPCNKPTHFCVAVQGEFAIASYAASMVSSLLRVQRGADSDWNRGSEIGNELRDFRGGSDARCGRKRTPGHVAQPVGSDLSSFTLTRRSSCTRKRRFHVRASKIPGKAAKRCRRTHRTTYGTRRGDRVKCDWAGFAQTSPNAFVAFWGRRKHAAGANFRVRPGSKELVDGPEARVRQFPRGLGAKSCCARTRKGRGGNGLRPVQRDLGTSPASFRGTRARTSTVERARKRLCRLWLFFGRQIKGRIVHRRREEFDLSRKTNLRRFFLHVWDDRVSRRGLRSARHPAPHLHPT